jgi:ATP-dependent Lhr-like helicase
MISISSFPKHEGALVSAFERLSSALQYQVVNTLGFRELRPVQLQAIDALLDGKNAVVLAPTAGGKTEAAFFPLLSMMDSEDWRPVSVLYLSPIRALLNNQEDRVSKYAALIGRRAFKWHGDTGQSARKRFLAEPTDILLITPESLEAMLMSTRVPTREVFEGLRAVIIDEVHAFADDDRGAHLSAILERLTRFCGKDLQRIGLSATVGNPQEILRWVQGSSKRDGIIVDPGGAKKAPELALDFVGTMENAATVVERLHPGRKRLVFVDSRRGAEELGHLLTQHQIRAFVMHGSLAVSQRRDAEQAFTEGSDCVIVATSAMELGIDIGDLDHVLQIDCPSSVASFLQRMGRTGRRGGAANCTFLIVKEQSALQAAALLRLYRSGYVEPVQPSRAAYHILAHQLMSMAVQFGGIAKADWHQWVAGTTAFADITNEERNAMVDHMLKEQILSDQEGKLWLGTEGERRYAGANFRALYAVFDAPRLITVRAGLEEIGSVDANFLMTLLEGGKTGAFTLGGRAWEVVHVDWERGICVVHPIAEGRAPRWSGSSVFLGYELCQSMRNVLLDEELDEGWSVRMRNVITTLRAEYGFLRENPSAITRDGNQYHWYTFAGGAANVLLARILESLLGEKVTANNLRVAFQEGAAKSEVAIRETIETLAREGRPNDSDALAFAQGSGTARLSNFDKCLPEIQLLRFMRERLVDLEGAKKAAGNFGTVVSL